jgi:hypothetical protein
MQNEKVSEWFPDCERPRLLALSATQPLAAFTITVINQETVKPDALIEAPYFRSDSTITYTSQASKSTTQYHIATHTTLLNYS